MQNKVQYPVQLMTSDESIGQLDSKRIFNK